MVVSERLTLSADGQTAWVVVVGPARVSITGTFGGGTAQIETKDPGGNAVDMADGSFTEAADKRIDFPPNSRNEIRVDLSGATSPALVVWVQAG